MANFHCEDGFAWSFHFRNMLPPMKHVRLKLITLNSRVSVLFETLPDVGHKSWVDNMRTSVNFSA